MSVILVIVLVLLSPISVWAQTTLTVNLPTGTQNNDFLVMAIAATAAGVTCPSPLIQLNTTTNSANEILTVCTGLSNGTPSFSVTGTGVKAILRAYRGAQTVEAFAGTGTATIPALPPTLVYNDTYAGFFFNDVTSAVIVAPADFISVDTTTDQTTYASLEGDKQVRAKGTAPNAETGTGPSGNWLGEGITLASSTAPVTIVSIAVAPNNPMVTVNNTQAFTATATLSNNTQQDITGTATWSSSNTGIATMSGSTATCVSAGASTISAVQGGVTGSTTLTCSNPSGGITFVSRAISGGSSSATITINGTAGASNLSNVLSGDFLVGFSVNVGCPMGMNTYQIINTTFSSSLAECWVSYTSGSGFGTTGSFPELVMYDFRGAQSISVNAMLSSTSAVSSLTVPAMAAAIGSVGIYGWFSNTGTIGSPTPTSLIGQPASAQWTSWDGYVNATGSLPAETAADGSGNWMGGGLVLTTSTPPPTLVVSPSNPLVAVGNTQTFTATENGTTVSATWTSGTTSVATMSGATATCVAGGNSTITGTFNGVSGNTLLTCGTMPPPPPGYYVQTNFGNTVAQGNPETFGGCCYANSTTANTLAGLGFHIIRDSYSFDKIVPQSPSITEAQYESCMNATPYPNTGTGQVCDPNTWNWANGAYDTRSNPDISAGMVVMAIMGSGEVVWNKDTSGSVSCSQSTTASCPPQFYTSYNDMVKKIYQHYSRPDRIEIWNEPDQCPNQPTVCWYMPASQYATYYANVAGAIRSVDSTVQIGGPVAGNTNSAMSYSDALHAQVSANLINFISFHNYSSFLFEDTSVRDHVRNYWPNIPIYITEWSPDTSGGSSNYDPPDSVAYVGNRLLSQFGLGFGSTFYSVQFLNGGGLYTIWNQNDPSTPTPIAKAYAWYLLGTDLMLNQGSAQIQQSAVSGPENGVGAITTSGHLVMAAGLDQNATQVTFQAYNVPRSGNVTVSAYLADHGSNNAQSPIFTSSFPVVNGVVTVPVNMTAQSVGGIVIQ